MLLSPNTAISLEGANKGTSISAVGTVTGTVNDVNGAPTPVNGATVKLCPIGTTTTTNISGVYTFTNVAADTYSVVAGKVTAGKGTTTGVIVTAGNTVVADVDVIFPFTPVTC